MQKWVSRCVIAALMVTVVALVTYCVPHAFAQSGGQIVVTTAAHVTGTGAAVQIATTGRARWIQVIATTGNSSTVNCGDSNVSATRGLPIAAGGGFMFPAIAPDTRLNQVQFYYSLPAVYCYVANGDHADFAWANN